MIGSHRSAIAIAITIAIDKLVVKYLPSRFCAILISLKTSRKDGKSVLQK